MILFQQAFALTQYLSSHQRNNLLVGFVPTMGALHEGHLSLVKEAKASCDLVVCSIFVNPTQFNNPDDFKKYPITIEKDIELLISMGCDVLFLPAATEIYPTEYQPKHYNLDHLEMVLEGEYRPGHFQGVCQVVDRLLEIVQPNSLFLGQKDYQQCQVIQKLLLLTNRNDVKLVTVPTVRESDGLAMSSRNLRLNDEQRKKAPIIYQALINARNAFSTESISSIEQAAKQKLTQSGFVLDYFSIVDAELLQPLAEKSRPAIALVAAYLDDIRLIDNLPLN